MVKHSDDRSALVVTDVIEDLIDFRRMSDRHLNRMRVLQAVQFQRADVDVVDELRPDVVVREQVVHAQELHKRGVALV